MPGMTAPSLARRCRLRTIPVTGAKARSHKRGVEFGCLVQCVDPQDLTRNSMSGSRARCSQTTTSSCNRGLSARVTGRAVAG